MRTPIIEGEANAGPQPLLRSEGGTPISGRGPTLGRQPTIERTQMKGRRTDGEETKDKKKDKKSKKKKKK